MEFDVNESARSRAWKDTKASFHQLRFFWGVEIGAMSTFIWLGTVLIPEDASRWVAAAYPAIGGIIGAAIGFGIIFAIKLFWSPYRQRDEARELVEQQRKPSDSEMTDAIRLLEAETLLLRNNSGEERLYSFAQVLLAIKDQLTIGVSLIHFEEEVRKGLSIGERAWGYFPSEDAAITHLIGILAQNALIDRHNEEYQHMERELVSGQTGLHLTTNTHQVKHTEVKYYLSSLGSRVVQQLRQQSVAHKKDGET